MEQDLINYFSKISPLTPDEQGYLLEGMIIKHHKKGDYLVKEGQHHDTTYFVLKGLVRQFKLIDGNDVTTNFFTEEQWIMSLADMQGSSESQHNLICVEDCTLVIGDERKALELFKKFPRFEGISRQIVEAAFIEQQSLMASYITDKPEQRYLKLQESRPEVIQRVPQYDIASFIGVKPESLSRIRKKLQQKL